VTSPFVIIEVLFIRNSFQEFFAYVSEASVQMLCYLPAARVRMAAINWAVV
jgi:hypothetical protein